MFLYSPDDTGKEIPVDGRDNDPDQPAFPMTERRSNLIGLIIDFPGGFQNHFFGGFTDPGVVIQGS
jgi:hypothetical protein